MPVSLAWEADVGSPDPWQHFEKRPDDTSSKDLPLLENHLGLRLD